MGTDIIVIIVLVAFSAYFSSTETAFTSASRIRLKNMANDGNKRAERALKLIGRYDELLSTILVGNNIANTANTAVATTLFVAIYGEQRGTLLSTIVMTIIVLVFGEVTPKTLAKEYPESIAMFVGSSIHVLMLIFTPVNWLFALWKKLLLHAAKGNDHNITEDELITIVEEAETEGSIPSDHSELIQNAIEFDDIEAWDVLTPRVEMKAVDIEMSEDEIAKLFLDTGFSRLPVYEDDLDSILGVLNQKDFHNYIYHKGGTVSQYIRPVVFCAGSMKAFSLLQRMQHRKCQIAIVVDEYGGTTGLVAMEDIIEELVGEIYDEHEIAGTQEITPLKDGSYRVLGQGNLDKLFDYFDEDEKVDAVTVNGWVVRELDHLPKVGDTFTYETKGKLFHGKVTKADARKALEINLRVEDKQEEEED